jgi:hypothetical protein
VEVDLNVPIAGSKALKFSAGQRDGEAPRWYATADCDCELLLWAGADADTGEGLVLERGVEGYLSRLD